MYKNVWTLSDSDDEEEETCNIDDHDISDSDMLESLSYSVFRYWGKGELNITTCFELTGWMLCVITQIFKYASDN